MRKLNEDEKKIRVTVCLSRQLNYELQVLADDSGLSRSSYLAYLLHSVYKGKFPDSVPLYYDDSLQDGEK